MKIKTSEATEIQLDYLAAKALGYTDYPDDILEHGTIWHTDPELTPFGRFIEKRHFHPSTNWSQGGPIIERERIQIFPHNGATEWCGVSHVQREDYVALLTKDGPTPLIAAMRAFVTKKFGDEIEIPEELK